MKKLLMFALIALLAFSAAVPAFAQEPQPPQTVDGRITITGQPLHVTPLAINFDPITLNGTKQTSEGHTDEWLSNDPTGTGAGWHVEIKATDFIAEDNVAHTISVEGFEMLLDGTTINAKPGVQSALPISLIDAVFTPLSGEFQPILSADIDAGMGLYGFTPDFQLAVPPSTYVGSYVSTVTVQISATP